MAYVIKRYNNEVKAVSDDKETAIEEVLKKYDFSIEETEEELETYDGELHTESYVANIKANIAEAEKQQKIVELKKQLVEIDDKSMRAVRALLAGVENEDDKNYLKELETQAETVREELQGLLPTEVESEEE